MIAPGNFVAVLAMLVWPVAAYVMFTKMPIHRAIIWSVFSAMLLLPVSTFIQLPLFPDLDKQRLSSLVVFGLTMLFAKERGRFLPTRTSVRVVIIFFVISPIFTVYTNLEPQIGLFSTRPGLTIMDAISTIFINTITVMPFLVGYRFLSDEKYHEELVKIILIFGLIYCLPILWELRMSPRLHSNLYGYFPHDWRQQLRDGGYRGVVFLGHGLKVAIFLVMAVICAASFWKAKKKIFGFSAFFSVALLLMVLVANKSVAAILFGFSSVFLIRYTSPRNQFKLASLILIICVLYPFLRGADLIPVDRIAALASTFDEQRGGSLQFRFDQEGVLLDKAREKQIFGWGGWGRQRPLITNKNEDAGVTDGEWLIIFGERGWVGYISIFGVIGFSGLFAYRRAIGYGRELLSTATLSVLLAFVLLDNLINGSLFSYIWLVAGALMGFADRKIEVQKDESEDGVPLSP